MKQTDQGAYTILEAQPGALIIRLTEQGREELGAALSNPCEVFRQLEQGYHAEYKWTKAHDMILAELLEDHCGNGWTMPDAGQIGALTSSPILAYGCEFNEEDQSITKAQAVYWFPEYQVESELETMLRQGFVRFTEADQAAVQDDIRETFKCELCGKTFDNVSAAESHRCN